MMKITNCRIYESEENYSSDGADVILWKLWVSLAQYLIETMTHAPQLRREFVGGRYDRAKDALR